MGRAEYRKQSFLEQEDIFTTIINTLNEEANKSSNVEYVRGLAKAIQIVRTTNKYAYTTSQLTALAEMAENDVYPDGRFGDVDCNVWLMFR